MIVAKVMNQIAAQAREETIEILEKQIQSRAEQGYTNTFSKYLLEPAQVKELEDAGYIVQYSEANVCHLIMW